MKATWWTISIFLSRRLLRLGEELPSTQAVVLRAAAGAGLGGVGVVHDVPDHVPSRPVVAGQLLPVVLPVIVGHVTAPHLLGLGPDELQVQSELLQHLFKKDNILNLPNLSVVRSHSRRSVVAQGVDIGPGEVLHLA